MHEADFWTQCADAMEQSIEGRRLIACEVAGLLRQFWREASLRLDHVLITIGEQPHLPPI